MTRRDYPGALPAPPRKARGNYNHNNRWVPDARPMEPFYCFAINGKANRNGHTITERGFYYVDDANKLHGPFRAKRPALDHARGKDRKSVV